MRPRIEEAMLEIAAILAQRATCPRLGVGCVLVDSYNRILSAGYNGVPRGWDHCSEVYPCSESGRCFATHAESNAIISCHAPTDRIYACYVTHSPCLHCCKQLIQTGCAEIHFIVPSAEAIEAQQFWVQDDRVWVQHDISSLQHTKLR